MPPDLPTPTRLPFRVKICGLTRPEDARAADEAGADAIGLNFYSGSPRCVSLEQARLIAQELPERVTRVGVFVNATAAEIERAAREVPLDFVQLHGDEPPELLAELSLPVLRAFRLREGDWRPIRAYLARCRELGRLPAGVLVDAFAPGAYGGTGKTVDWAAMSAGREALEGIPMILAGGLTPENIAAAIAAARPDGVDTASGIESSPGVKDAAKLWRFVAAASAAW
jgi:phosphoribosylanthranilate isomerase